MKVAYYEVPGEVEQAGLDAMTGDFTMRTIEFAVSRAGVRDSYVAMRIAERLLQREKKAGRIQISGNRKSWTRIEGEK